MHQGGKKQGVHGLEHDGTGWMLLCSCHERAHYTIIFPYVLLLSSHIQQASASETLFALASTSFGLTGMTRSKQQ